MAFLPLTIEIVITFVLSAYLLHRYSNWINQHLITIVSVFIAWFFSFIVIFILPLDISTTSYLQCVENENISLSEWMSDSHAINHANHTNHTNSSDITYESSCIEPWSYTPPQVLPSLWRIVYWTTQLLTWIALPLMQSYSMAGEFTVSGKLKAAFIENAIYYCSFAVIFIIILIYVSIKTQLNLEGLKIICITASNTWGLFLLVVLLGYGLVEIPRWCFNMSHYGRTISYLYFKVAKLSAEKCESAEKLEDVLEEIQHSYESLSGINDPIKPYLDVIINKCPDDWKHQMMAKFGGNECPNTGYSGVAYNEKSLIRMHKSIIKALQAHHRTHCQWNLLIQQAIEWEDVAKNETNQLPLFKSTIETSHKSFISSFIRQYIFTSKVEWYWKCLFRNTFYRILGYLLAIFSIMVVWSEVTFPVQSIPLSIFSLVMKIAQSNHSYFFIELFSVVSIAYLAICAYYTVFKVRIFNYYYLAPHHQTDEYSLIFCGMLLCRLAPPLCLNFLGLIHLDSHLTHKVMLKETAFTRIMGHLDVVSFIGDSFSIYLPICICLFCLATLFRFGSKILHNFGFEQFILSDELTVELIREGQELVKREKNKLLRQNENPRIRKNLEPNEEQQPLATSTQHIISANNSFDYGMRRELLEDVEPIDYATNWTYNSNNKSKPQKGLFDDI